MLKELALALLTFCLVVENPGAWNWHPNHLRVAIIEKQHKACNNM
jgi:hypothetical protein